MVEAAQPIIEITTPNRMFKGHELSVTAVAVFPDGRRMVTGSQDKTLSLWDLKNGVVLKKMEGHSSKVWAIAISRDGQLIASGDENGGFIVWHGATGKCLKKVIRVHSRRTRSLDFSPDGEVLAVGSWDKTTKMWNTKTRQVQENISCRADVNCVRFSPSGELLAIATNIHIQIWNPRTSECIARFKAAISKVNILSLAWTPGGTRLLSGGSRSDPTIREWDTSTWQQVGDPWSGHLDYINTIAVNSTGTLAASSSSDKHVRLWRLSDRRTIAIFECSRSPSCVTFSTDGKYIFTGSHDKMVLEWAVPEVALLEEQNSTRGRFSTAFRLGVAGTAPQTNQKSVSHQRQSQPPNNVTERENIVQGKEVEGKGISVNGKVKSEKVLRKEALLDAQKVIERNPSSYLGYQLKHAALHGAQRYDEAIEAFQIMLYKLDNTSDAQTRKLRQQYLSPSDAERIIRKVIHAQMENAPPRLLDTATGLLCDRHAQIDAFTTSIQYKELLSLMIKHADLPLERIKGVVGMYFCCVMLSHRWEGKEPLLHDIRGRAVYGLKAVGSIVKLQSFCRVARDAGYRWAWMDTCCIDQTNNVEVQESVNSMFVWYRHSALTIVYLSDVPPSSKSGALARSAWNSRGWTIQEFLAPKIVLFYQEDWTLYLDDCSSNHKDSVTIMRELGDATGIDARALVAFHPGMRGAREKLQWVSTRMTTLQEDIAYSLFGIFGVHLPVIYGEKKQNALGRLLQEVVAQSGDISALDWVGKSSDFNSCLPADITLYEAPACTLPSLSEDEMQAFVSSLRDAGAAEWASPLYHTFNILSAPRFAHCRLHLPCIAFLVTEVRRIRGQDLEMNYIYKVKADGLHDLIITTEDKLIQFSQTRPTRQAFLIVRPWDRSLLGLPDFADLTDSSDVESIEDWSPPVSPVHVSPGEHFGGDEHISSESHSQALRLIVRLGQRFNAFLLAQQWGGEYKRIASDHDIVAQVKDIVHNMMDVKTLEIL
ncbi:hypothetical protein M405DRAFT_933863 [Rhizopogon salebrosus TDB-379]|nr:hypothetical protein M405DRAFT_933863 [Rhizopogon salebrosus TDB-379]